MTVESVALVESPLQLLGAVEAAHANLVTGPYAVHWRTDVRDLGTAAAAIASEPLPDGLRLQPAHRYRNGGSRRSPFVLGDVFSGRGQAALLARDPAHVVLLDDGVATLNALRTMTGPDAGARVPAPLVRVGQPVGRARGWLGSALHLRLRGLARREALTVFTALPVPAAQRDALAARGVRVVNHAFEWITGLGPGESVAEPVVVVGSAFVADGLIDAERYLHWVGGIAQEQPVRYFPHRRQTPDLLRRLAELPGVAVDRAAGPVELRLRALGPSHRVVCLPSTAFGMLSLVLRSSGTVVEGVPVPDDWWTGHATPELRRHLAEALHQGETS